MLCAGCGVQIAYLRPFHTKLGRNWSARQKTVGFIESDAEACGKLSGFAQSTVVGFYSQHYRSLMRWIIPAVDGHSAALRRRRRARRGQQGCCSQGAAGRDYPPAQQISQPLQPITQALDSYDVNRTGLSGKRNNSASSKTTDSHGCAS